MIASLDNEKWQKAYSFINNLYTKGLFWTILPSWENFDKW